MPIKTKQANEVEKMEEGIEGIRLLRPDLPVSKHGGDTPEGVLRAKNEIEKWLKENPQPISIDVSITRFNTLKIEYGVMLGGEYLHYYIDADEALEEFKRRLKKDIPNLLAYIKERYCWLPTLHKC